MLLCFGPGNCDPTVPMSGHGNSKGFNQKRMENGVHHDEILIMDSLVDSVTVQPTRTIVSNRSGRSGLLIQEPANINMSQDPTSQWCRGILQESKCRLNLQGEQYRETRR